MDQTGVRACQHLRHLSPVEPPGEDHVVERRLGRRGTQRIEPCPVADQEKQDVAPASFLQHGSGSQHHLQPVGHADGPAVGDDEALPQAEARRQRRIRLPRMKQLPVDAVHDDGDPTGIDAPAGQRDPVALSDRDDVRRRPVGAADHPVDQLEGEPRAQGADRSDRLRPQVPNLEQQRAAAPAARQNSRPAAEGMGRCGNHHVGPGLKEAPEGCRDQIREPARAASPETLVGGDVRADPHHANSAHPFDLPQPVSVAGVDRAPGMVRRGGDHGDVVTRRGPVPAVRVGTGRRRVALGRKVVGEEEDAHQAGSMRICPQTRSAVAVNAKHGFGCAAPNSGQ